MAGKSFVTYRQLLDDAEAEIETLTAQEALVLLADERHLFVDIREAGELDTVGRIPGALHVSRGMLEFVVCPTSPFYDPTFSDNRKLVFFCAGGWRSALAAQHVQAMGVGPVAHIAGGFDAWVEAGGKIYAPDRADTSSDPAI